MEETLDAAWKTSLHSIPTWCPFILKPDANTNKKYPAKPNQPMPQKTKTN